MTFDLNEEEFGQIAVTPSLSPNVDLSTEKTNYQFVKHRNSLGILTRVMSTVDLWVREENNKSHSFSIMLDHGVHLLNLWKDFLLVKMGGDEAVYALINVPITAAGRVVGAVNWFESFSRV